MKNLTKVALISCLLFSIPATLNFIPSITPICEVQAMNMIQDPNGFADLHWGETLESVQESHKTKLIGYQSGTASYHIFIPDAHGSVYFIGPVTVRAIFMDNKLLGIMIPFSKEMFSNRLSGMTKLFGTPENPRDNFYAWMGPFSFITLTQNDKVGIVTLIQKPKK